MKRPSSTVARLIRAAFTSGRSAREVGRLAQEVRGLDRRLVRYVKAFYGRLPGSRRGAVRVTALLGPRVVGWVGVQHALVEASQDTALPDSLRAYIWRDCIHRALASRLIAKRVGLPDLDTPFMFALVVEAGLLGLLEHHPKPLQWIKRVRGLVGPDRMAAYRELLGETPAAHFAEVLRRWDFPQLMVSFLKAWDGQVLPADDPFRLLVSTPVNRQMLQVVRYGDALGQALTADLSGPTLEAWVSQTHATFGFSEAACWKLIDDVIAQTDEMAEVLAVPVCTQPGIDVLRRRRTIQPDPEQMSREELIAWTSVLQEQNMRVERKREEVCDELESLKTTDGVTGLETHMSFLEGLQMSRKMPGDTAILLIDIDGFHLINTRYGHAGGDKVLRSVAALLQRVLKDALQIARVGGDVFAVRMVTNRRVLVLAERMRAAIESSRAEIGKHRVRLTVSVFGVTSADLGPHSDAIRLYNTVYALRAEHKSRPPNRTWWAGRSTATAQPEEKVLAFPREVNGRNGGNGQSSQTVQFFGSGPPVTTE